MTIKVHPKGSLTSPHWVCQSEYVRALLNAKSVKTSVTVKKERNTHHKDNHGSLTCAVCNEVYETPSDLHRHKYRHTDKKFTCETCREQFPFESQFKDHCTKHLTGRAHTCFAKNCGKSFKNKSRLMHHVKVHSGKVYRYPEKKLSVQ